MAHTYFVSSIRQRTYLPLILTNNNNKHVFGLSKNHTFRNFQYMPFFLLIFVYIYIYISLSLVFVIYIFCCIFSYIYNPSTFRGGITANYHYYGPGSGKVPHRYLRRRSTIMRSDFFSLSPNFFSLSHPSDEANHLKLFIQLGGRPLPSQIGTVVYGSVPLVPIQNNTRPLDL